MEEAIFNRYEYERAYNITVARLKEKITTIRDSVNKTLDELEHDVNDIMKTARCMKGGGVTLGKVWDLYPINPEDGDYETLRNHLKHLKDSKYPIADALLKGFNLDC